MSIFWSELESQMRAVAVELVADDDPSAVDLGRLIESWAEIIGNRAGQSSSVAKAVVAAKAFNPVRGS
jgi:hypothetical protein